MAGQVGFLTVDNNVEQSENRPTGLIGSKGQTVLVPLPCRLDICYLDSTIQVVVNKTSTRWSHRDWQH